MFQELNQYKQNEFEKGIAFEINENIEISSNIRLDSMINLTKQSNSINFNKEIHIETKKRPLKGIELISPPKFNPFRNAHDKKKFEPLFPKTTIPEIDNVNSIIANMTDENEFEEPLTISRLNYTPMEEIRKHQDYVFGNYDKYYNYRYDKRWQDPRIKLLDKEYFFNKKCLDIGCNDGTFTIMIAIKYFPILLIGVDIDYRLINKAIHNLHYFEKQNNFYHSQNHLNEHPNDIKNKDNIQNFNNCKDNTIPITNEEIGNDNGCPVPSKLEEKKIDGLMEKLKSFPKSFTINMGIPTNWGKHDIQKNLVLTSHTSQIMEIEEKNDPLKKLDNEVNKYKSPNDIHKEQFGIKNQFPDNVNFRIENFIKDMNINEKFDTILCLSVTKWIHLNWGDCGIRRLFKKIYDSLNPRGILILEPQEWKSYKKRKYFCDDFKKQYRAIQLRPHQFENYLVNRLEFNLVSKIVPELNSIHKAGFKRPIYFFQKS